VKPKIVQYGAGNIGRSLVGQLFSSAGWEVVFIDVVPEVVDALNRIGEYRVVVKEAVESEILVRGVRGVDGRDSQAVAAEIATCDLMGTAVGPAILPRIAPVVALGLRLRKEPLDILLCENLRGAPDITRKALAESLPEGFPVKERVGLVATSIGKMVPIMPSEVRLRDPLEVWAEAYTKIIADRHGFIGRIPEVPGLIVRDCFEAYVDQKLFVHNLGHAAAAYLGDRFGVKTIAEAMAIAKVESCVRGAMQESGEALVHVYSEELAEEAMAEHIADLCRRFHNVSLGDTVYRVGRDRPRKYAPDDRLIGALKAQHKTGVGSDHTLEASAAGLFFSAADEEGRPFPPDVEFGGLLQQRGIEGVLQEVSGLDPGREWDRSVIERVKASAREYQR
jgi:mannitol-1-phosphate 5-dehydrogenase